MSSIKECTLAFFKGLAFGKGLIIGRELAENKDMAEDRWITIHPFGNMKQGEADAGEGKRYYQRIFINDETDEIEGGLGGKLNGTKIKDLGKKLKELRDKKGGKSEGTGQAETKKTEENDNLSDLAKKIKALTDGKEYTEEVANKVGDLMRQELEKNKDYIKAVSDMERVNNEIQKLTEECKKHDLSQADLIKQKEKENPVIQEYEKLKKEYVDLLYSNKISSEEYDKFIHSEKYQDLAEKAHHERININFELGKERLDIAKKIDSTRSERQRMSNDVISAVRESLKDVINFSDEGVKISVDNASLKQNLDNGLRLYSKELLGVIEKSGVKAKFSLGRSSFSPGKNVVEVDKDLGGIAHEFAHCIEHNNPQIVKLEEEFYNRRTKDEKLKTMKAATGNPNYRMDERTRTDKFLDPYMGKDYGFARHYNMKKVSKRYAIFGDFGEYSREEFKPDAYELLSMGVETLIEKPHLLKKDPDYANFVLGCLAYKG